MGTALLHLYGVFNVFFLMKQQVHWTRISWKGGICSILCWTPRLVAQHLSVLVLKKLLSITLFFFFFFACDGSFATFIERITAASQQWVHSSCSQCSSHTHPVQFFFIQIGLGSNYWFFSNCSWKGVIQSVKHIYFSFQFWFVLCVCGLYQALWGVAQQ